MDQFLQLAHDTWIGQYARTHAWVFTTGLVLHFIGLCFLLGAMLVIDLRLLGLGKSVPIKATFALLPVAIAAFILNLLTGIVFFCFDPAGYWNNAAFRVKLVLLLVAGLNALIFTVFEHRKLAATGPGQSAPWFARLTAGVSLLVWFGVILFGRLIVAFQGSPDLFG